MPATPHIVLQVFAVILQMKAFHAEEAMTAREAIKILMLSPIYFTLPPSSRLTLIKEYCTLYEQATGIKK